MKNLTSILGIVFSFLIFSAGQNALAQNKGKRNFPKSGPIKAPPTVPNPSESSESESVYRYNMPSERYEIGLTNLSGVIVSQKNRTSVGIGGTGFYLIRPKIQVGGKLVLENYSGDGSSYTAFGIMGLAQYNFSNDLPSSIYAGGGLGLMNNRIVNATEKDEMKIAFEATVGKRFPTFGGLTFAPQIGVLKVGELDAEIRIDPIHLTYLF